MKKLQILQKNNNIIRRINIVRKYPFARRKGILFCEYVLLPVYKSERIIANEEI